jgi:hypothetical protein
MSQGVMWLGGMNQQQQMQQMMMMNHMWKLAQVMLSLEPCHPHHYLPLPERGRGGIFSLWELKRPFSPCLMTLSLTLSHDSLAHFVS